MPKTILLLLSIAITACVSEQTDDLCSNGKCDTVALCYEHTCNGSSTGHRCFDNHAAYCDALCSENNCAAELACRAECRSSGDPSGGGSSGGGSGSGSGGGGLPDPSRYGSDEGGICMRVGVSCSGTDPLADHCCGFGACLSEDGGPFLCQAPLP